MSHSVALERVTMAFGETRAVDDVSFTVEPGEFFSILGPSGCGKTTILRMVAGFLAPSAGRVLIGERDMAGLGPNQRPTAMIFQSLALFPLMPVWENIAFGLEARGVSKEKRRRRAEELLDLIALSGYGERKISELSGGQKQRVAIARALAVEPQVLLLDEPLSALDLKLRQHMRAELRTIQKRTGVTFLYITHDQSEALAMSDRVAVMSAGVLQQVAAPRTLYDEPATPFVATFVGETNAVPGRVVAIENGEAALDTAHGRFTARAGAGLAAGAEATLYVRPEALTLARQGATAGEGAGPNVLAARAERLDFEGAFGLLHGATADGARLLAALPSTTLGGAPAPGAEIAFSFSTRDAIALPGHAQARPEEEP
ncbi:ABC transporter ATP-binding protein [Salinarimonas ramus]|uniref:Spermidine/putrescine ABC transporter ATP-binding protein n=1 Tax=Salinarimonas ramus TaxID=690164 RepID=A0A917Q674_9HYPH|nr:ABC transporter ATP-binding protein [Salinarimonas ramus]GGK27404.1 spermidine/putrescine ABC transporter ATP-binding protein [Salinarimonas ramus]